MGAIMKERSRNIGLTLGNFQGEQSVRRALGQNPQLQFSKRCLLALTYSHLLELNMSFRETGPDFPRKKGRQASSQQLTSSFRKAYIFFQAPKAP